VFERSVSSGDRPALAAHEGTMNDLQSIEIGFQVYLNDGDDEVGAVRGPGDNPDEIIVYIENAGDFAVPLKAVRAVHYSKVVLDKTQLEQEMLDAIGKAHDAEDR
jgi:hypothetical protein